MTPHIRRVTIGDAPRGCARKATLIAAALGLVLGITGCSLAPSGLGGPKVITSPASSPSPAFAAITSLNVSTPVAYGTLAAPPARISCTNHDRTVAISGTVQGVSLTIKVTNVTRGQHLSVPPIVGGFSDLVTMTTAGSGPAQSLDYVAGDQGGTYQGVGTLTSNKHGTGGQISLNFGSPVGQAPSVQASGDTTTFGANDGSVFGTWQCP